MLDRIGDPARPRIDARVLQPGPQQLASRADERPAALLLLIARLLADDHQPRPGRPFASHGARAVAADRAAATPGDAFRNLPQTMRRFAELEGACLDHV